MSEPSTTGSSRIDDTTNRSKNTFSPTSASGNALFNNQLCCLIDTDRKERCSRLAGNASYNKRIQKIVIQKKLKLSKDPTARHIYICSHHKNMIQNIRVKKKQHSDEEGGELDDDIPEVDLHKLQLNTLRRYKKHYKLQTRPGMTKAQLAETVGRHFRTLPVNDKDVLTHFIYIVKSNKNRIDFPL